MENSFKKNDWLYINDDGIEMLFRFDEYDNLRWTTSECYQVINNIVYINKGRYVITTSRTVELASQDKIDEILNLAKESET